MNYILGVAGQNAANARALASSKMDRSAFLATVAAQWAQLDPAKYPSVHAARTQLREHDDREQFLAGIETANRAAKDSSARLRDKVSPEAARLRRATTTAVDPRTQDRVSASGSACDQAREPADSARLTTQQELRKKRPMNTEGTGHHWRRRDRAGDRPPPGAPETRPTGGYSQDSLAAADAMQAAGHDVRTPHVDASVREPVISRHRGGPTLGARLHGDHDLRGCRVQNDHSGRATICFEEAAIPPISAVILSAFCISPGHDWFLRLRHVADVRLCARLRTQRRSDEEIDAGHVRDIASGAS
jgi:hypothetical protein